MSIDEENFKTILKWKINEELINTIIDQIDFIKKIYDLIYKKKAIDQQIIAFRSNDNEKIINSVFFKLMSKDYRDVLQKFGV